MFLSVILAQSNKEDRRHGHHDYLVGRQGAWIINLS
jgi:hypothetical protein